MIRLFTLRDNLIYLLSKKRDTLLSLSVIVGLLGVVAIVGWLSRRGETILELGLAGAVGIFGLLLGYRQGRSEYGILAVAFSAGMINFFTLPTGTESRLVISLLVAAALVGIWIVQLLLSRGRVRIKTAPINLPLFTFLLIGAIAYVWSILLRDPLVIVRSSFPVVQLAALAVNTLLPLFALYVANKVEEVKWLRWLTWLVVGMGAFVVFSLIFHLPTTFLFSNGSRGLFGAWVGALALGLALFDENLAKWKRGLLIALVGAWVYYDFFRYAFWLSGWVPLAAACMALVFFRSRKLFGLALIAGLVLVALNYQALYQGIFVANVEEGSAGRVELWETNIDLILKHPLFGVGPAGYAAYYLSYHPLNARSTHNNYFDVLAQTGILGFIAFLWMMGAFVYVGWQARKALAGRLDFEAAFANATLAGTLGALVAMMLGDWVLPFAYNQTITGFDNAVYTWMFMGGMAALYQIVKKQNVEKNADASRNT
jgi:O-antigen ligase